MKKYSFQKIAYLILGCICLIRFSVLAVLSIKIMSETDFTIYEAFTLAESIAGIALGFSLILGSELNIIKFLKLKRTFYVLIGFLLVQWFENIYLTVTGIGGGLNKALAIAYPVVIAGNVYIFLSKSLIKFSEQK